MKNFVNVVLVALFITTVFVFSSCEKEEDDFQPNVAVSQDKLDVIAALPYPTVAPEEIEGGDLKSGNSAYLVQLIAFSSDIHPFVIQDGDYVIRRFVFYITNDGDDDPIIQRGYVFQYFEEDDVEDNDYSDYEIEYTIGFDDEDGFSQAVRIKSDFNVNASARLFFTHHPNTDEEGILSYNRLITSFQNNGTIYMYDLFPPIGQFNVMMRIYLSYCSDYQQEITFDPCIEHIVYFRQEAVESNVAYRVYIPVYPEANSVEIQIEMEDGNRIYKQMSTTGIDTLKIDLISFIEEIHMTWNEVGEYGNVEELEQEWYQGHELEEFGTDENGVVLLRPL